MPSRRCQIAGLTALLACLLGAQVEVTAPKKRPYTGKPDCSPGAICFRGEVKKGERFQHAIDAQLDFVLIPREGNPSGWTMEIEPKQPTPKCQDFIYVVNPPYREHSVRYLDTSYAWKAEEVVADSPREFKFVTNCADYEAEYSRLAIVLWGDGATQEQYSEALAKLGSSPLGAGRLWITGSKTHHADRNDEFGTIDWIRFAVELKMPPASPTHTGILQPYKP